MTGNIMSRTELSNALFRELSNYKRISKEEETKLFKIYKDVNSSAYEKEKAKEGILLGNIRWIVKMAKQYSNIGEFNDIFSEAYIGAEMALDRYSPDKDVLFMSFARYYIQRQINAYLNRQKPLVRITNYVLQPKIRTEINKFAQLNERNPTTDELRDIMKDKHQLSIKNHEDLYQLSVVSSDGGAVDDDDAIVLSETSEYTERTSSDNLFENYMNTEEHRAIIKKLLNTLSEKERNVVSLVYGLGEEATPMSYQEVAEYLSYTTGRVRQIIHRALKKMQCQCTVKR